MKKVETFIINFTYAWNWRKPILIFRLIKVFSYMLFTGRELLRYVDLQIGKKCNIRCKHCFANMYKDGPSRLTPQEWAVAVDQAMDLGAVNFSFQGGEPLLYPDLLEYVRAARPWENVISVTTNGMFVTKEKCKELKKAGVDILTISIDEFRPMDYKEIIEKARLAKRCGMKVTIGTVISHENFGSPFIQEMIDLAEKERMILVLILAAPVGEWEADQKIMLTDDEAEAVKAVTKVYNYVRLDFDATYLHHKCPAGTEVLYITSEGEVQSCPFIPRQFGNIKSDSIKAIRDRILASEVLSNNRHICMAGEKQGTILKQMIEEGNNHLADQKPLSAEDIIRATERLKKYGGDT